MPHRTTDHSMLSEVSHLSLIFALLTVLLGASPNSLARAEAASDVTALGKFSDSASEHENIYARRFESTARYRVIPHPINRSAAIVGLPPRPSAEMSLRPTFSIELGTGIYEEISALSLQSSGDVWGSTLTIGGADRDSYCVDGLPSGAWIGHVAWSPNGNWLSFVLREGSDISLWVVPSTGGMAFSLSNRQVNLVVRGQATDVLIGYDSLIENRVPYAWAADESAIYFSPRSRRTAIPPADWVLLNKTRRSHTLSIPGRITSDFEKSNPGDAERIRTLTSRLAFSEELVRVPIEGESEEQWFELPNRITQIVPRLSDDTVTVVTRSDAGSDESLILVKFESEAVIDSLPFDPVAIPQPFNGQFIPAIGQIDAALYQYDRQNSRCVKVIRVGSKGSLGKRPNELCLSNGVLRYIDAGRSILAVDNENTVYMISKETLEILGRVRTSIDSSKEIILATNRSPSCRLRSALLAASRPVFSLERLMHESQSGEFVSEDELIELDFGTESLRSMGPLAEYVKDGKVAGYANCSGEAVVFAISKDSPVNYSTLDIENTSVHKVTSFQDVMPEFVDWQRINIDFERSDGVPMSVVVVLPNEKAKTIDGKYPALIWQYPMWQKDEESWRSYRDARPVASRHRDIVRGTYQRPILNDDPSTILSYLIALEGYAVVFMPDFPLIGVDGNSEYGSFRYQAKKSAEAWVDAITSTGVIDKDRIAIGGHSRGGGFAAQFLADTDLFSAGVSVAGSGSFMYKPTGFQFETRTYWEYPYAYTSNSVILSANRIDEPLLLLHGELDSYPSHIDSKNLNEAIVALGGESRFVVYPNENHQPKYSESVVDMLQEISDWLAVHTIPK